METIGRIFVIRTPPCLKLSTVALPCQDRNGLGTELVDPEEAAKGKFGW